MRRHLQVRHGLFITGRPTVMAMLSVLVFFDLDQPRGCHSASMRLGLHESPLCARCLKAAGIFALPILAAAIAPAARNAEHSLLRALELQSSWSRMA
jgi:hypothetical protein